MEILLSLVIVAGILWMLVATRQVAVPVLCLLIVMVGVTFGHSFWNKDVGPIPVTFDRIMLGGLIFGFAVWAWHGRANQKPVNATDVVVGLLAVLLIGETFAHNWHYKNNLPFSRLLFFNLLPMCFYFLAKNSKFETRHLYGFLGLFASFGLYLGLTGIAEQRGWTGLVFPKYISDPHVVEFLGRARGPFLNPVALGIYLVTALVAAAALCKSAATPVKTILVTAIIVMMVACFATFTRSVWLGCVVGVAAILWLPAKPQIRGALIVTGTLGLLCVVFLFADKLNHFQRDKNVTADDMSESASLRPMLAHVAFKMFVDKPVLGHGFGQYSAAKKPYHYTDTGDMPLRKILPYMQHNVFLSYLTESGVAGLTLLLALLLCGARNGFRIWFDQSQPWLARFFGLMMLVFLANYCINGMFHDVSIIAHTGALLYLLLGIGENLAAQQRHAYHKCHCANVQT